MGDGRSEDVLVVITGERAVRAVALSHEGAGVVVGGEDCKVAMLVATTGDRLFMISRRGAVFAVAFSPDGARVVVGGEDYKVAMLDATT